MINNKKLLLLLLLAIAILTGVDFFISKFSYPIVEGWLEFLATESQNKVLYKDIYFSMPPLYLNLLSLLIANGFSMFDLRMAFQVIHIIEFLCLTYFISRYYNYSVSIISALISELLIACYIDNYLPKDYHMLLGLLVALYLIIYYYFCNYKNFYWIIFLGAITSLILLTKQNVGFILFMVGCFSAFMVGGSLKSKIYLLFLYLLTVLFLLSIYSFYLGHQWINVYVGNDAKGSIFLVFTRFLDERSVKLSAILLTAFYTYSHFKKYIYKYLYLINNDVKKYAIIITSVFFLFSLLLNKKFEIILGFLISALLINLLHFIKPSIPNVSITRFGPVSLSILAILYCNTMTAGFNLMGSQVGVALFIAIALNVILSAGQRYLFSMGIIAIIVLLLKFTQLKLQGNMYQWWGYKIGGLSEMKFKADLPQISGIYITKETNDVFGSVISTIKKSKTSDKFYFYPSIPFFYNLFNIPVLTKFPILWFDMIPNKYSNQIINEFRNIDPDYIVWLKPPYYAYDGHARLRNKDSVISEMDAILLDGLANGFYSVEYSRPLGIGGADLRDIRVPITAYLVCNRCADFKLSSELSAGAILDYNFINTSNINDRYLKVIFQNPAAYVNFSEKYRPLILNSDYPIFMIIKKN